MITKKQLPITQLIPKSYTDRLAMAIFHSSSSLFQRRRTSRCRAGR